MSVLLFRIGHHVPDDELHEVRQLLTDHGIDFYETTAGVWQVGLAGIWLHDPAQENQARELLDNYQQQRSLQAREQQAELEANGKAPDFLGQLKTRPLRLLGVVLGLVLILLVSLIPVFWLLP